MNKCTFDGKQVIDVKTCVAVGSAHKRTLVASGVGTQQQFKIFMVMFVNMYKTKLIVMLSHDQQ